MKRILKYLRVAHDYSKSDLSKKMGISPSYISKLESGEKSPSESIIKKYCKVFHISKKAIMMFSDKANSEKNLNNQQILLMILQKICKMEK